MRDGGNVFPGGRRDGRGWQFLQGGSSQRDARGRGVSRIARRGRAGTRRRRADGEHRPLVALPPAAACEATFGPLHRPKRRFLLRMLGDDSRLRFDFTDQPEFNDWRWVDYWSLVREVIYFKRAVYARALQELPSSRSPRAAAATGLVAGRLLRERAGASAARRQEPVRRCPTQSSTTCPSRRRTRDRPGSRATAWRWNRLQVARGDRRRAAARRGRLVRP